MMGTRKVSLQPDKIDYHRHCSSGGVMSLICHVILQDRLTKRSCDLWVEVPRGKLPSSHL